MTDHAEQFERMAADIRAAAEAHGQFAGAVVVVPPGEGKPIAFLTSAIEPNVYQFWTNLKSVVEEAMALAQAEMTTRDPWARR